jgi:hypothetical protein
VCPVEKAPHRTRPVRERHDARLPALVHPEWADAFPWLVQGTTTRGPDGDEFDLGFFSHGSPPERVHAHWNRLLAATAMPAAVLARQVHEAEVRVHDASPPGLQVVEPCDGHATREAGVLLAVTVADCVPVFLVDAAARRVALVHAGWRGTAAGVLERGLSRLGTSGGAHAVHVHLGPAICGECYEVGPEVFEALGAPRPTRPTPLDLRGELARRAVACGVDLGRVTVSEHCTRCTGSALFSHRAGDLGRQVGYLGIRL